MREERGRGEGQLDGALHTTPQPRASTHPPHLHLTTPAAADALILAREVIAGCASQRGMQASFLPKTAREWAGNASHLHLSLQRGGQPVMAGGAPWEIRPEAEQVGRIYM